MMVMIPDERVRTSELRRADSQTVFDIHSRASPATGRPPRRLDAFLVPNNRVAVFGGTKIIEQTISSPSKFYL
jgi:hypothetical protein